MSRDIKDYILFSLRSLGIFLLLLLLINPAIERKEYNIEKPELSVLIDNSQSIGYFNKENEVNSIVTLFNESPDLKEKFNVVFYQFGEEILSKDSLSFSDNQTNIFNAIDNIITIQKDRQTPIVVITDGNQTQGNSFEYLKTNKEIFPILIGDTITKSDIKIEQLNVNKYSYLKNKFPVEIRVVYEGNNSVNSQLIIQNKGKVVFRRNTSLSKDKNVATILTNLTSNKEGLQYYTASLTKIENEENLKNNSKSFSIEVLNEQTKIVLLTSIMHPDLGTLKKSIETNKQRSVEIYHINDFKKNLRDYQLVMLYQPTTNFVNVFEELQKNQLNYFVFTGANTNWDFLNEIQPNYYKNSIDQTEEYGAAFNNGFLTFGQKDVNFETFQPLKDKFGSIRMKTKFDALLYQNISGIKTKTPLLATFENQNQKSAVLFGEGIWKWRATSFLNSNSFHDFDGLVSNLIQYLASTKKRERLTLNYEKLFAANSPIKIAAYYVDKNFKFDARANINLQLTNTETGVKQNAPFSLLNNSFEAVLENLPPGNYRFVASVQNQNVTKTGQFKITNYNVEEQFTKANNRALKFLAANNSGKVYYSSNSNKLIEDLIDNNSYTSIQKEKIIFQNLIDWKVILLLTILVFTIEWFLRKYLGML